MSFPISGATKVRVAITRPAIFEGRAWGDGAGAFERAPRRHDDFRTMCRRFAEDGGLGRGVDLNLELAIWRTFPDHGTAYDAVVLPWSNHPHPPGDSLWCLLAKLWTCAGGANQDPFHMDSQEFTGSPIPPQPPYPYPARADVTGEIYKPSYFHSTSRPKLAQAPDKVLFTRNPSAPSTFSIKVNSATPSSSFVDRVVLMRPGAVNHALNSTQRYIELSYEVSSGSFPGTVCLKATAPAANLGPVGYYMLFVVVNRTGQTPNRLPTNGHFIRLM